ncbi:MAG: helix-turn-helix domain-containing protein, partial [Planctomycetes bacterium]|nr:helix-turn-helix domain-containing protein [Planctomycetota bacterium]
MTKAEVEFFPPGEFIRDELEARNWTQEDLAEILGRPLRSVNQIIAGKKAVTPQTAQELAAAFGTTPE